MKAILFFVVAGNVLTQHKAAAESITKATGKKVVFRSASSIATEKPEPNEGVAGDVPKAYAHYPIYDNAGNVTANAAPAAPVEVKLNDLGLPMGSPIDREGLKAALDAEGVVYHGNTKLDKLIDLYRAHFFPVVEK